MAMSVHACLPSSCKNQHSMKTATKSPNFLRRGSSMRQNAANRKSAVERLEESKANYVKSESVLDTKQEFKNSSHLRVSTGPQLDIFFKAPAKHAQEIVYSPTNVANDVKIPNTRSCLHQQNPSPQKSPPPVRSRAKSHSEARETHISRKLSFASRSSRHKIGTLVDIESQLKRLITSGSKENIAGVPENVFFSTAQVSEAQIVPHIYKTPSEVPKVRRGYSDPIQKSSWLPHDTSPEKNYCIHKSMPDLSPPCGSQPNPNESFSSEESDDSIFPRNISVAATRHLIPKNEPTHNNVLKSEKSMASEKKNEVFDSYKEPRRFSNGTGTLHLTPYCMQSSQYQRRPVSRSKSDVTHRHSKRNSEYFPRRNNNYTTAEIERFFDTMGLDTTLWHHITSPSLVSSPPCFFESISSIDSNDDRSSVCSEESVPEIRREGLRNHDLRGHGPLETSIVEKNARVIKWLYNCRKASRES